MNTCHITQIDITYSVNVVVYMRIYTCVPVDAYEVYRDTPAHIMPRSMPRQLTLPAHTINTSARAEVLGGVTYTREMATLTLLLRRC